MLSKTKLISLIIAINVVLAPGTLIAISQLEQIFFHPIGNSSIGGNTQLLVSYVIWNILLILFVGFKLKNVSVDNGNNKKSTSNLFFTVIGILGILIFLTLLYLGVLLLASTART